MGRRIMNKKGAPVENRTEDFMKMDSLHYLADNHDLRIMSFAQEAGKWSVSYLKPSLAIEPVREESRDDIDYDLKITSWIRACTVRSKPYPSFQDMVQGEIERLKAL